MFHGWSSRIASACFVAFACAAAGCAGSDASVAAASSDPCAGLTDSDVARVDPRRGTTHPFTEDVGKQRIRTLRGVRVVLPAEGGMGPAFARRLTACRVARAGIVAREAAPVVVRSRELGDALEVTIASDDVDVARAIVRSESGG